MVDRTLRPAASHSDSAVAKRLRHTTNFAGTGCYFSSKIAEAAEKMPPTREDIQ
jgi:hydroxymethylpyrimidine/phosphomethylpyrimidine kinase